MWNKIWIVSVFMMVLLACNEEDTETDVAPNYSKLPQEIPGKIELGTVNGIKIYNGGFGSGAAAHPKNKSEFYLLTDRGPNTDFKEGKKFLAPTFSPAIGHFRIKADGSIELLKTIKLTAPNGSPITGLPNPKGYGATGETAYDLAGGVLSTDMYGIDSEGLVAMNDGSFWVSDEYGPHIAHFDASGKQLERISPTNVNTGTRKIPAVFEKRRANRGMEGLCVSPDQKTLVGIMQSMMYVPTKADAKNKTLTRIVTFDIATGATKQFLYRQESKTDSNSDIVAISNTEFLVIERDGKYGSKGGVKQIFKINIAGATDVNGSDINALNGMQVNGKALEQSTWDEIEAQKIIPVSKTLVVELVSKIGYEHDKLEGIIYLGANKVAIFNDDDFAVLDDDADGNPEAKILPKTGTLDVGTMYVLDIQ